MIKMSLTCELSNSLYFSYRIILLHSITLCYNKSKGKGGI